MRLDLRVVWFTFLLALLSALLFGLAPSLQKPDRFNLGTCAKYAASHARFRQVLVAVQIGLSMALLAGAALLLRSFWNLQQQQLGLHADTTLTASLMLGEQRFGTGLQRDDFYHRLSEDLRYAPGVSAVAVADSIPPAANHNQRRFSSIGIAGRLPTLNENGGTVTSRCVTPDYFRVLGISLLRGTGFTDAETSSRDHFVVLSNALAGRLFPNANPIGERLQLDDTPASSVGGIVTKQAPAVGSYLVVGVAAAVKNSGLANEDLPEYYKLRRNQAEDWEGSGAWDTSALVLLRSSAPVGPLAAWVRSRVAAWPLSIRNCP